MKIIHTPFGLDDPFLSFVGQERTPHDPLEGAPVKVEFATIPMTVGQRAWVEVKTDDKTYTRRAQYQFAHEGKAHWTVEIEGEPLGTRLMYRFIAGRGPSTYVTSDWYEYTTKKWVRAENFLTYEGGRITLAESSSGNVAGLREAFTLTDGEQLYDLKIVLEKRKDEKFYGLGEHYDTIEIPLKEARLVHVYDQYKVQKERGYAPAPFIFSNRGRAILLESGFTSSFFLDETTVTLKVYTKGESAQGISIRLWNESSPLDAIRKIYEISNPVVPPLWALGPWISANQWNSQEKVLKAVEQTEKNELPTTVLVIEAWSDEQSYYIFNGARAEPVEGGDNFELADFEFRQPWPDPIKMVEALHARNIKLILWQIPTMKWTDERTPQPGIDIDYGKEKGFFLLKSDGQTYTVPEGRWREGDVVLDFFNDEAADWWAAKRRYLFEELAIDGFKTDGGEHLWGRDTLSSCGSAARARNLFPEVYFKAAKKAVGEEGILFSRSGYTTTPAYTLFWVGDEDSTWEALRANITAGLNVSLSGNPFWGWDIGGFSGELPSSGLYKRAVELAVFTPIFQLHSEDSGDPTPSSERTPWNIARFWNDDTIIDHYRRFASLRMTLSPYIHREAVHAAESRTPLTLPLFLLENRNDPEELAYLFGRDLIVSPAVDERATERALHLPEGIWINLWSGEEASDSLNLKSDRTEVYLRKGSSIPLSVPTSGQLFAVNHSQEMTGLLLTDTQSIPDLTIVDKKIKKVGEISGTASGIVEVEWRDI